MVPSTKGPGKGVKFPQLWLPSKSDSKFSRQAKTKSTCWAFTPHTTSSRPPASECQAAQRALPLLQQQNPSSSGISRTSPCSAFLSLFCPWFDFLFAPKFNFPANYPSCSRSLPWAQAAGCVPLWHTLLITPAQPPPPPPASSLPSTRSDGKHGGPPAPSPRELPRQALRQPTKRHPRGGSAGGLSRPPEGERSAWYPPRRPSLNGRRPDKMAAGAQTLTRILHCCCRPRPRRRPAAATPSGASARRGLLPAAFSPPLSHPRSLSRLWRQRDALPSPVVTVCDARERAHARRVPCAVGRHFPSLPPW